MRLVTLLFLPALVLAGTTPSSAAPGAVDRIVAVVGDTAITLSELRDRARPFLEVVQKKGNAVDVARAEAEMNRALLDRMIDEALEAHEAAKLKITVSTEEVDAGLRAVAAQNKLTVVDVLREAKLHGMSEPRYREEIGRQILEGKLLQIRIAEHRAAITKLPDDQRLKAIETARTDWLKELRLQTYVEARL